jgi:hypothetical protein
MAIISPELSDCCSNATTDLHFRLQKKKWVSLSTASKFGCFLQFTDKKGDDIFFWVRLATGWSLMQKAPAWRWVSAPYLVRLGLSMYWDNEAELWSVIWGIHFISSNVKWPCFGQSGSEKMEVNFLVISPRWPRKTTKYTDRTQNLTQYQLH